MTNHQLQYPTSFLKLKGSKMIINNTKMEHIITFTHINFKAMLMAIGGFFFAFCDNCLGTVLNINISPEFTKDFDVVSLYVSRGLSIVCSLCGIYLFFLRKKKENKNS